MKKEVEYLDHENLVIMINKNKDRIINALTRNNIDPYIYLHNRYWETNVEEDNEYRKKFSSFYIMRWPNQNFRDAFFKIMEEIKQHNEPKFEIIARKLYPIQNIHHLSFITKFLNTRFDEYPIYDSFVAKVFNFKRGAVKFEDKLIEDKDIINHMSDVYSFIKEKKLIQKVIDDFDDKFPGNTLPFTKKIDFFIWRLGMIQDEDK